jgi:putative tricarboxylic transport membrane protein
VVSLKSLTANVIGCIFFLLVGIWFLVNSLFLTGTQNPMDVGPAAFPILSSIGIILASLFYMIREVRKKSGESSGRITITNRFKVIFSMILLVAYILVMQFAGYYIASIVFIPFFLYLVGVKNLLKLIPVSVGFILFVYVVFDILLEVPMP